MGHGEGMAGACYHGYVYEELNLIRALLAGLCRASEVSQLARVRVSMSDYPELLKKTRNTMKHGTLAEWWKNHRAEEDQAAREEAERKREKDDKERAKKKLTARERRLLFP